MTSTQPEQDPSPLSEWVSRVSTTLSTVISPSLTLFQKRRLSEPARQNNDRLTKRANMASGSMETDLHQVRPNPTCRLDPLIIHI